MFSNASNSNGLFRIFLTLSAWSLILFPSAKALAQSGLQVRVDTITLPTNASEFAIDWNGDGIPDNKMGKLLELMNHIYPMQGDVDQLINNGSLNILFEVSQSAPPNVLRLYQGVAQSATTYAIDTSAKAPKDVMLEASGDNQKLVAGPGPAMIPNAFRDTFVYFPAQQTLVTAQITPTGELVNGQANAALHRSVVESQLIPLLSKRLTSACNDEGSDAFFICMILDSDGDGTITTEELLTNWYVQNSELLTYDVDTDGDGQNDSMSLGFGFTAKAITIVKGP